MAGDEPTHRSIRKDYADTPASDYTFLRKKAIELIQKFSGRNWTDFNIHDPGITILELLCYAITDLAYRTGFPVTDLLADEAGNVDEKAHSFVPANRILSSAPLSIRDFRKLLIDAVPDVSNVWLEPIGSAFASTYAKGAYRVIIQASPRIRQQPEDDDKKKETEDAVIQNVKSTLAAHRNVAEDFTEFIVLQPQKMEVAAQIVISKRAVPEELLAEVYFRIEQALNPRAIFYTEQELLAQGMAIEDIYKGPLLEHGILPDGQLKDLPKAVDKADLIRAVSDMPDVLHIRRFQLKNENADAYANEPVVLKERHYPLLSFNPSSPGIVLYYDNLPVPVKAPVFYRLLQRLHDTLHKNFITEVHHANIQKKEGGVYRNVQAYTSLQNLFPAIYRIGSEGLEAGASPLRKAQAKQLKAYLLFFEHILAGCASQLGSLNRLFSPDVRSFPPQTYFFQPLYQVPDVAPLLVAFTEQRYVSWEDFTADEANDYIKGLRALTESDETYNSRKNGVLDHLLSRFNIVPDNYPVILYQQLYGGGEDDERISEEIKWKAALLSQVETFTYYRMRADDYSAQSEENTPPGFHFNMRLLLHIQSKEPRLSNAVKAYLEQKGENPARPEGAPEGETQTILYDGEALTVIKAEENHASTAFHFPRSSIKFFEWGIDQANYRIVPYGEKEESLVLYKSPPEQQWHIVRRYNDRRSAQTGISELMATLIEASIQSEGFYLVEHLLLAPPRDARVFGFTFYDESGKPLLQQARWTSFGEREETIQKLIDTVVSTNEETPSGRLAQLQGLCKIGLTDAKNELKYVPSDALPHTPEEDIADILLRLESSFQTFRTKKTGLYPAFSYTVFHWDGSVLEETFFDNRVTVVFPSWPLRFQHEGFRQFTEDVFRSHLPLHINVGFLWLNVSKMIRFEDMFFNWKEALKAANRDARRMESVLLTPFLQRELKHGKP